MPLTRWSPARNLRFIRDGMNRPSTALFGHAGGQEDLSDAIDINNIPRIASGTGARTSVVTVPLSVATPDA